MGALMPVRETAELLGVPVRTVYEAIKRNSFPPGLVVRLGRRIFFVRARLHEWLGLGRDQPNRD